MTNPYTWLKRVDTQSLRYRFVSEIWRDKTPGKACSFYWFKFPVAVLGWIAMCILYLLMTTIGFFFGFVITIFGTKEQREQNGDPYYPYREFPNGWKLPIVPWHIAAVWLAYKAISYFGFENREVGGYFLIGISTVLLSALIIFMISKNWSSPMIAIPRQAVVDAWNRVCPTLEIVETRNSSAGDSAGIEI